MLLMMAIALHAQINNPFASKGEIVAPVVRSAAVGDIVVNSPDAGQWNFDVSLTTVGDGKELVTITMDAPQECMPPKFNVYFSFPQKGVFNLWNSKGDCYTHLDPRFRTHHRRLPGQCYSGPRRQRQSPFSESPLRRI